jgi:FkbM family methyltransferase
VKDTLYKAISGLTYRLIPATYFEHIELSRHLRVLFSQLEISCVIDVGANDGQYRNFLRRRCGYEHFIVSYEPVRAMYDNIRARARNDKYWTVENCALGAQDGELEFNVMRDSQFSSFLRPAAVDVDQPDLVAGNTVVRTDKVEVRTLRTALGQIDEAITGGNIYLKLDTQGYDFPILRAAGSALDMVCALQTEMAVKPIYQQVPDFTHDLAELKTMGFELTGLFPVNRDRRLRVIEFDAVAVRTPSGGHSSARVP